MRAAAGWLVFVSMCLLSTAQAATFTVNTLSDAGSGGCTAGECTLREAIAAASGAGPSTIQFSPGLNGTITLGSQLLINFNGLVIDGPGADVIAVSGGNATRVFRLFSTNVTIRGLTVRDGNALNDGTNSSSGGIYISNGGNVVLEDLRVVGNVGSGSGAGILAFFAAATIRRCEVSDNASQRGSGIAINGGAGHNVLVENTTISGNIGDQAESGINVLTNTGQTVTLRHVTVSGNLGSPWGAIIEGQGNEIIEASVFAGNDAANGDLQAFGSATINNSVVQRYTGNGGGANNRFGADPWLGPLMFFDGSISRVHAFSEGPAHDLVDTAFGDGSCGTTLLHDQIGNPRPAGGRCDAGAFEVPAPTVLADWTLDEFALPAPTPTAGQRVIDLSGNGRDARVEQGGSLPTTVPGVFGSGALHFTTGADRVVFSDGHAFPSGPAAGSDIDFSAGMPFTIEAVVRVPAGSMQTGAIVAKDVGASAPSWWLRVENGVAVGLICDGPNEAIVVGSVPINDGNWHHVAFVRDAAQDVLRLYVDHVPDTTATDTTAASSAATTDIVLGAFNAGTRHLTGDLDRVRISSGVWPAVALLPIDPLLLRDSFE